METCEQPIPSHWCVRPMSSKNTNLLSIHFMLSASLEEAAKESSVVAYVHKSLWTN